MCEALIDCLLVFPGGFRGVVLPLLMLRVPRILVDRSALAEHQASLVPSFQHEPEPRGNWVLVLSCALSMDCDDEIKYRVVCLCAWFCVLCSGWPLREAMTSPLAHRSRFGLVAQLRVVEIGGALS